VALLALFAGCKDIKDVEVSLDMARFERRSGHGSERTEDGVVHPEIPVLEGRVECGGRVREMMYDLRKGEGIDYFPDYLTEYDFSIRRVEEIMVGKTSAGLSGVDVARVKREMPLMTARWENVLKAEFDPRIFGFTPRQVKKLNKNLKMETHALTDFEGALSEGDRRAVVERFGQVKQRLADVERLFGNFEFVRLQ
jgi:hypothetical protein